LISAVIHLLQPRAGSDKPFNSSRFARDYLYGNEEAKQEAREIFADYGITEDHIMAEALRIRGDGMSIVDRMDKHRANEIRLTQKEIARRAEVRDK
jgi:hypothetical protein